MTRNVQSLHLFIAKDGWGKFNSKTTQDVPVVLNEIEVKTRAISYATKAQ